MAEIVEALKSRWHRFWGLIDSESIVVNQMLFYVLISLNGFVALAAGGSYGSRVMMESTSAGYYFFWLLLLAFAPLTTIIGKLMKGRGAYAGLWLQLAGDLGTWTIFVCYITGIWDTDSWQTGGFAGTLALCCLFGTPLFVARDIRRLRQVEERVKKDIECSL